MMAATLAGPPLPPVAPATESAPADTESQIASQTIRQIIELIVSNTSAVINLVYNENMPVSHLVNLFVYCLDRRREIAAQYLQILAIHMQLEYDTRENIYRCFGAISYVAKNIAHIIQNNESKLQYQPLVISGILVSCRNIINTHQFHMFVLPNALEYSGMNFPAMLILRTGHMNKFPKSRELFASISEKINAWFPTVIMTATGASTIDSVSRSSRARERSPTRRRSDRSASPDQRFKTERRERERSRSRSRDRY